MIHRLAPLAGAVLLLVSIVAIGIVSARDGDQASRVSGIGDAMADSRGAQPTVADRTPAPSLDGEDPLTGRIVRLGDFSGKPVVINVWASWCPGCNDEAEDLREFAAAHPEVVVLGLDFQDTVAGARSFYERWEWRHPSIFDPAGTRTAKFGLVGLPSTYFLDSEHRIAARIVGATDRAGFERGLELATAES